MGKKNDFHLQNLLKCRKANKNWTLGFSITGWPDQLRCHGQAEKPLLKRDLKKPENYLWTIRNIICNSQVLKNVFFQQYNLSKYLGFLYRISLNTSVNHIYLISLNFCQGLVLCFTLGQSSLVREFCVYYHFSPFNLLEHEFTFTGSFIISFLSLSFSTLVWFWFLLFGVFFPGGGRDAVSQALNLELSNLEDLVETLSFM